MSNCTIIVGDVHGCWEELHKLLRLVQYVPGSDRLIFVGDLLDRGPDPVGCLRWVRENAECVLSNHDEKHARYRRHTLLARADLGYQHPMRAFQGDRQSQHDQLTDDELGWVAALPISIVVDVAGKAWRVMHAGMAANAPLARQETSQVIRTRYVDEAGKHMRGMDASAGGAYWADRYAGEENVVHGHHVHTLEARVTRVGRVYGIDTGCVFGGYLTALVLWEDGTIGSRHVKARRAYAEYRGEDENA